MKDLNLQPLDLESIALPIAPTLLYIYIFILFINKMSEFADIFKIFGGVIMFFYCHPYIASVVFITLGILIRNSAKDEKGNLKTDDGAYKFGSFLIAIGVIVIVIKLYIDYNNYKSSHPTYRPTQYNQPLHSQPIQYSQLYSQPVQYYQPQYYTH